MSELFFVVLVATLTGVSLHSMAKAIFKNETEVFIASSIVVGLSAATYISIIHTF
jgi:hypothetical protein